MIVETYESVVNWPLLILLMISTGVFAGLLAGLLGVGGGIVVVPVLYQVFTVLEVDPAVKMHLCVGTSLAIIIPTSARSAWSHFAKGALDRDLIRRWAAPLLIGVLIGTAVAGQISETALTLVFAVVALVVSLHMCFSNPDWRLRDSLPGGATGALVPLGVGGVSAIMGIGGGTLGVPLLSLFNFPIHRAVGTASGFGLIIGIPGAIGMAISGIGVPGLPPWPWTLGYVSVLGFVLIVPATVMAAPWGVFLAHRMAQRPLRLLFGLFLLFTCGRMFWDVFNSAA